MIVEGAFNQYALGGVSCCTHAAALWAELMVHREMVTTATVDCVVRAAAAYKGDEHTFASAVLGRIGTVKVVRDGVNVQTVSQLLDVISSAVPHDACCAAVVIKSMESVCVALDRRGSGTDRWVLFDSHGRPERGLPNAFALVFSGRRVIENYLVGAMPFLRAPELGDIPEYVTIECTVVVKKEDPQQEKVERFCASTGCTSQEAAGEYLSHFEWDVDFAAFQWNEDNEVDRFGQLIASLEAAEAESRLALALDWIFFVWLHKKRNRGR